MAERKRFAEGIRELHEMVGRGALVGKVVVDQVYAKYQHERLDLKHPRGGGPRYLAGPLYSNHHGYLERLAKSVLEGELERTMLDCMESLNGSMSAAAPINHNNLRRSGSPRVTSDGRLIAYRKAQQRRLTEQELRALHRGRRHA